MKYQFRTGRFSAVAETVADVEILMKLKNGGTDSTPRTIRNTPHRYRKPCSVCGKKLYPGQGMASHMRKHEHLGEVK